MSPRLQNFLSWLLRLLSFDNVSIGPLAWQFLVGAVFCSLFLSCILSLLSFDIKNLLANSNAVYQLLRENTTLYMIYLRPLLKLNFLVFTVHLLATLNINSLYLFKPPDPDSKRFNSMLKQIFFEILFIFFLLYLVLLWEEKTFSCVLVILYIFLNLIVFILYFYACLVTKTSYIVGGLLMSYESFIFIFGVVHNTHWFAGIIVFLAILVSIFEDKWKGYKKNSNKKYF